MTTQQAIAKARAVNLQEALGVPIARGPKLGELISIPEHPQDFPIDLEDGKAEEHTTWVLDAILAAAKRGIAENNVTRLHHAELTWLSIDMRHPLIGCYRLYLATAP